MGTPQVSELDTMLRRIKQNEKRSWKSSPANRRPIRSRDEIFYPTASADAVRRTAVESARRQGERDND